MLIYFSLLYLLLNKLCRFSIILNYKKIIWFNFAIFVPQTAVIHQNFSFTPFFLFFKYFAVDYLFIFLNKEHSL